jgi:uncharacterized damage-inducible protein DinB
MNRKEVLIQAWKIANDVESWFAPVKKALENVDAAQATWKPEGIKDFNSIQEITLHLLYYKTRFWSRLTGSEFESLSDNEATFTAGISKNWEEIRNELYDVNTKIMDYLLNLEDSDLDNPKPKAPIGQQVLDLATHDAYHSAQLVLIRKLQGAWQI